MRRTGWLIVPTLALATAACGSSHATRSARGRPETTATLFAPGARSALEGVHVITALGDSVPYGTACKCTPYPQLVAAAVSRLTRHTVATHNDAVPGGTTALLLHELGQDGTMRRDIARSNMVLVEVGANDVARSQRCGNEVACYQPRVPRTSAQLDDVVRKVRSLAPAHVQVVMLDYWNVWLGGQYAKAQGADYADTADALTTQVNQAIRSIAHRTDSTYVDLRTAFRGPDHDHDETKLLAPDGDHPNAEGHELIAEAIAATIGG